MLIRLTSCLLLFSLTAFVHGQGVNVGTGGGGITTGGNFGGGQGGTLAGFGGGTGQGGAPESISGLFNENSTIQGSGFLGRNANTTGFLTGAGTATGGGNGNAGNQFGNAGGFGGGRGGGNGGGGQQPQRQQSTRVIRTRISIPRDFGRVVIPPSRIQSNLNLEYRRVSNLKRPLDNQSRVTTSGLRGSSILATPSGNSVILSGTVGSERDRIIAEKMAKMEPGVRTVVNQIMVSPQSR